MMDPILQLDPERCICVLGPQIAAQCLEFLASNGERTAAISAPPALSYKGLVELGVQKLLEVESFASSGERARRETLLMNTYELEPCFAANKVTESLRANRLFESWVTQVFSSLQVPQAIRKGMAAHPTIKYLLALQAKGLRLAYSHYDTVLATALGELPVLLENEDGVRRWYHNSRTSGGGGLLYLHGLHAFPASMKWDCVSYPSGVGDSPGAKVLKEVCKNKMVMFIGFDGDFFDPFLPKFASVFCDPLKVPPLFVTFCPPSPGNSSSLKGLLTLQLQHGFSLERAIVLAPHSRQGMSSLTLDPLAPIDVVLLYREQTTCMEAADKVKNLPTVKASNLKITQDTVHRLSMNVDRAALRSLWTLVLAEGSQLQPGLVGVSIDWSLTVWLTRGMKGRSPGSGRSDLPTLSTAVSVISSMWTPITSPAVSKLPPSTRPPLPSPLVSAASRALQKGASAPELLKPGRAHILQKGASTPELRPPPAPTVRRVVYDPNPQQKIHPQPRRVQSEHGKLTYHDRVGNTEEERSTKNGILLHRESAPAFLYTPEGIVPYLSTTFPPGISAKAISVPSPSPLMTIDKTLSEHRIEYIDQYKQAKAGNSGARVLGVKKPEDCSTGAEGDRQVKSEGKKPSAKFSEKRRKFIEEAQEWSKKLKREIEKSPEEMDTSSSVAPTSAVVSSTTLGGLGAVPDVSRAPPSLVLPPGTHHFSPEDQEKILRQHFEHLQQQQNAAAVAAAAAASLMSSSFSPPSSSFSPPSSSLPVPANIRLHPNLAGTSTSPGLPSARRSPKPSPIQLPTSPRISPLHPFLLGGQSTAPNGGVFTYVPSNPSLQSPAGFIYSPPVFNPYQAATAMQMLSPQVSGKSQQPFLVSDPSILQSFQQSFGEKLVCLMPDGTLANIPMPTTSGANQSTVVSTSSERTPAARREAAVSPIKLMKRLRSPEVDADFRGRPLPKRRRSSSLPDITHLAPTDRKVPKNLRGVGREERVEEGLEEREREAVPMNFLGLKTREAQPPNMIHIPKDIKLNDPMFGFPTPPPHGSPLHSHFTASPLIQMAFHTQPMTPVTPSQEGMTSDEIKELVEAAGSQAPIPPSPEGSCLPPFPAGRGPIQLWQFLLDLLLSPEKAHMIMWTGNGYEFRILQPEEIAKLWGARKNKPKMNYDKLSRGLRYYYSKGIMDKVPGKKLTFKYTCDVQHYVSSRGSPLHPARTFNGQHAVSVISSSSEEGFKS